MTSRKPAFLFSLRYKIAIPFVTMVLVIMAIVTYFFTIREMKLQADQVKLRMERLANNIATIRSVGSEDWSLYQSYIENQISINPDIVYIAIFNEFRDLKAHVLNTDWVETPNHPLSDWDQAQIISQLEQRNIAAESQRDFESVSVTIMMSDQCRGYVHVGFSMVEINNELWRNLIANLEMGFIFTVAVILVSFFMSHKIVNPLSALTRAMKKISEGNLDQEVVIQSKDEIGEMASAFNYMTSQLKEKVEIESFGRQLGFTLEAQRIFHLITHRIAAALDAKKVILFLRKSQEICDLYLASAYPDPIENAPSFQCDPELHTWIKNADHPQSLDDFQAPPSFRIYLSRISEREEPLLICPMKLMEDAVGILVLNGRHSGSQYSESEKSFLATLIRQAVFALENVLLLNELTEQERLKQELKIAGQVQHNLLPRHDPKIAGFDIQGLCLPATEIGGDYFDYFGIDQNRLGITIADVTGKGTSAAFYMAVVKGLMTSLTKIHTSPKILLSELNRRLYDIMDRHIFITMIYAVIDQSKRCLIFSRAGHNSLLIKDRKTCSVHSHVPEGIGLGLEKGEVFDQTIHEETISLNTLDTILFYTDGIIEAANTDGIEFGEERLINLIRSQNSRNAGKINQTVIAAVKNHAGQAKQQDDMTLVAITRQ
ncbi:SpoIIE family protein phosphatase [bacterium]|nr:SpoIIE family protein phosphatase [bacterium]